MAAESVLTQARKEEEVPSITLHSETACKKNKGPNFLRKLLCCFRASPKLHTVQASSNDNPLLCNLTLDDIIVEKGKDKALLAEAEEGWLDKKCLVIDLDETLVHSSFAPVQNADFTIPVEIDGTVHQVYVLKRPYVDEFLQNVGKMFECVLFTASLGKYADPVTDLLDKWGCFKHRLFRESCVFHKGSYVKDLSRLGRPMEDTIILDNSPASYMFHPNHAVPILSWFDDQSDTSLLELMAFFQRMATTATTATTFLRDNNVQGEVLYDTQSNINMQESDSSESVIYTVQNADSIITSVAAPAI